MPYVHNVLPVETNIVVFRLKPEFDVKNFLQILAAKNIKSVAFRPQAICFATHLDVYDTMIDYIVEE